MSTTYFLLTNLKSKEKTNAQFFRNEFKKIFEQNKNRIDIILGSKMRMYLINPKEINELKRSEKLGKFKIKRYKDEKKRYERLVNRVFYLTRHLPENYAFEGLNNLFYGEKHRLRLFVPPITQEILYYDWKSKIILNNLNLHRDEELVSKYLALRSERTQLFNNEYLKFLNLAKHDTIIILDEINHDLVGLYSKDKKVITHEVDFNFNNIILEEIGSKSKTL